MSAGSKPRFRRVDCVRAAVAGEDVVLLHLDRGTYFTLNATGAWIWERMGDGATLDELGGAVVERFEVDAETARRDVDALVAELAAAGLIEPAEPA